MRAALILAFCGILAVVTQTTLLGRLGILPAPPNLILILSVYIGLRLPTPWGALGAFLLGYLLDTVSGSVPGLHCFTMTLVFAMVYFVSGRLWMQNPFTRFAIMILGCILEVTTLAAYFTMTGNMGSAVGGVLRTLVIEAALALLIAPLAFSALDFYIPAIARKKIHAAE
ncbi:MAG: rod shape-determining protein MreD [Candidatus Binatia bacterium]|jgi:rod shape-determining protein MreD|nr:rod shape-determining protein MreD [Candidatus Binatia bacterium]MDG1957463.1 rod shape-determining protein MreD [Candidatus Binatia bacterium]MDG2009377.1 rod shape-determining protein MreD [Candidatus Binatia bacterium]HAC78926.1 rod shape-determining protein MreD [Deltaproteobacteria bacterium]